MTIALHFMRPFEARNVAEFTIEPAGDELRVTWAMHGPNLFPSKVMSLFLDMDELVGKDFAAGLANMKKAAEG